MYPWMPSHRMSALIICFWALASGRSQWTSLRPACGHFPSHLSTCTKSTRMNDSPNHLTNTRFDHTTKDSCSSRKYIGPLPFIVYKWAGNLSSITYMRPEFDSCLILFSALLADLYLSIILLICLPIIHIAIWTFYSAQINLQNP